MSYVVQSNVKPWGNSSAVRLTKELLAVAGFSDKEEVEIIAENEEIIIRKQKKKSLIEQLEEFKAQGGFYEPSEEDLAWTNMKSVGAERWWENE